MKNLLLKLHSIIKWLIFLVIFLALFLVFVLESPATVLDFFKSPLKEQGITYGTIKGGVLSGFTLTDVHYKNQVHAKEMSLKVDIEELQNRVLKVENLVLDELEVDKEFLASLIDTNSTQSNKTEEATALPFDRIIVNNADISLKNIAYQRYKVHRFKLHVNNLDTDMKKNYQGDIHLSLKSNMAQANLDARLKNDNYHVAGVIEAQKSFLEPFVVEKNVTFLSNPKLKIKADGNLEKLDYDITVHRLDIKQNEYVVHSKRLHTFGSYSIAKKDLINHTKTFLLSNMGDLNLDSRATLNIEDVNNTLVFKLDSKFKAKNSSIITHLEEQNISIEKIPTLTLYAKGDMKDIEYRTTVKGLKAKQNDMALDLKDLELKGRVKPLQGDLQAKLLSHFDSSLAGGRVNATTFLNYKDVNNTLTFTLNSDLKTHGRGINKILKDTNVTLNGDAHLLIDARGNLEDVLYDVSIKHFRGKQNEIVFNLKDVNLKGSAKPLQGDVDAKLVSYFDSSFVGGNIDAQTSLNYKDVNNTLTFELNSDLKSHGRGFNKMLKDVNVTLNGDAHFLVHAKGNMENIIYSISEEGLRGKQNEILFNLKKLALEGSAKPLQGDIEATLHSTFNSSVLDGNIEAQSKLNYKDLNNTLQFETTAKLKAHDRYINRFLKESNVTVRGDSDIEIEAKGGMKKFTTNLDLSSNIVVEKIRSFMHLKTTEIEVDLEAHQVDGSFTLDSSSKNLAFHVRSLFSGDYMNPKSMTTKSEIDVNNFNAFGIDLRKITPLNVVVNSQKTGAKVNIESKKIQLTVESKDYNHVEFTLKTEKIYPSKLLKKLPEELKEKFIKVDLVGKGTLSNTFLTFKGYIESNQEFKAVIDAKNSERGLDVKLHTDHLKMALKGDIERKDINLFVNIDSVTQVQEEFVKLYPFTLVPVDGAIKLEAKMRGEEIFASVTSSKLKMENFNIEALDIDAHYKEELLTLNALSFNTTGFIDSKLNKLFYLNKKGTIYLGEEKRVFIDMHPKILLKGGGNAEDLNVEFTVESLPLGYPDYGSTVLSSQITYTQRGKKKKIIGGISLEKLKILYESKFLDVAHDSDVVVITKKDKHKKKKSDSFLEDTYIDLAIYAPDAEYKTRDIELEFTVDVKAKKFFGESLGMLGKVRDINGRVEQAPKLFTVVDSNIVFRGTQEINPLLDIYVEHELPDVLITINIHGDAKHPKLDFSSDPSMAKKDILSYLLLGVSTANLSEGGGSLGREAQLFIMNQAARDFAYEVDLDRVFIKDDGTGEGYAVQVGKKVDDDTMVIIENSKEGNSFIIEHEVSKSIKIEVGHHQKTVPSQSIDVFFRKRFR